MRYKEGDVVFFKYPGTSRWDWGVIIIIDENDTFEVFPFPLLGGPASQLQELAFTGELVMPFSPVYITKQDISDTKTMECADKVAKIRDDFAEAFVIYNARMKSIEKKGKDLWEVFE